MISSLPRHCNRSACAMNGALVNLFIELGDGDDRHFRLQNARALLLFARSQRNAAAVLLVVLLALPALGQQTGANTGTGFPTFGSFAGSDFDTINEGKLNIHFSIPVFQKSGRGLSVSAVLTYDSLIWSAVPAPRDGNGNIDGSAQWRPPAAAPWGWNLAPVSGYVTYSRTQTPPGSCGTLNNGNGIFIRSDYTYHSPDGTGHYMGAGQAVEADCNGTPHGLAQVMTRDGSGYSLSVDTAMNVYVSDVAGNLILPFQFNVSGGGLANPGTLNDTNGNQLTFNGSTLTDTLGTTPIQFSTTSSSASVKYPSPTNPANLVGVTLNYSNYSVQTAFPCSGLVNYGPQTMQLVSSILLPDGSTYSFTYEPTPGVTGKTTARIASVTLPTGGVITYAYPNSPIDCSDGSTRQLTRTTPDGQWTYTRQITETAFSNGNPGTITSSITTVTDPLGNTSVINFGVGDQYESKRQVYTGSSTLLQTIETCYNGAAFPCTSTAVAQPITRRTVRRELPDATGKVAATDTNIAAWGLPTDVYEYDFGSGAPGSLVRHTATTYASLTSNIFYNPSQPSYPTTIFNRPATVTVTDGSGATQSQTSYFYDETTPTPTSSPQHVSVTGSRGNLTTTKRLVQGTTTIQKTTAYNDTGTIATDTDYKTPSNVTTYGYGANSCGNSFPTTVTNPLWLEKTTVWDCNGAVATSITDQNSQITSYTYGDPNYWRITATAFPDTGGITTTYNLGTNRPWNIIQNTKLTSTQNITNTTIYDTLARVTQKQLTTDPEGIDYTDTTYDAAGHVHSVSNPYRTTSDPTYGLTSYIYDGLGRACLTVPPDGTAATGSACPATRAAGDTLTTYSANCTTVTDQAGQVRKSCADGLGRLTQVFEDPAGVNYETDYSYNALNDLLSITQKGGTTNSTQWRNRSFTYDFLSRLVCAANPEVQSITCPSSPSGPFPAGAITYSYDSNSNVATKVSPSPNQPSNGIGSVTTTYSYDALNRLTGKSYVDTYASNPATSPVLYGYDGHALTGCPADTPPSNTDSYPKGRRTSMCDGSEAATWTHDQMGRTKQESRSIATIIGQHDNDTYNLDGSVATTTSLGFQYSYTYSGAGRPISAVGGNNFVQSGTVTYAPFGGLTSAKMGPTPITITNAYNNRLQPLLISAAGASTIISLCYDFHLATVPQNNSTSCKPPVGSGDNGNAFQIVNNRDNNRTQNFLYDSLNRISQAYTTGPNWGETFGPTATNPGVQPTSAGIDAWGNLTNRSGVLGKNNMEGLSCAVDTQNHLGSCSLTYDAAGNVIANGNTVYTFDAENRLIATAGMSYKYDGDGKRVEKCTAGTTPGTCATNATGTLYWTGFGSDTLAETDLAGNVLENYIFFNGQRIARREPGSTPTIHFYFSDHLGSHGAVTDKTGSICEQDIDYYPYGGVENDYCGTVAQHYKFTGKERDTESGLDNFGARYDASSMGRFMTPDAFYKDSHVGDPQSWNEYAYARNNPLRYVDPNGENATVSTSCTTDAQSHTTCNVNITASIAIYAAPGSNLTQDQLNDAAGTIQNSIQNAWTGSFNQDGVTYNVATQVNVSVAGSQDAAMSSGAQNVIGMTNGPPMAGVGAYVNPKSVWGALTGAPDTGMMDINNANNYAKHEFTHLLGTGDKPGAVLSDTDPAMRPGSATGQDFGWGIREVTSGVNGWKNAPQFRPMRYGEEWEKPSSYSNQTNVGAPAFWWK